LAIKKKKMEESWNDFMDCSPMPQAWKESDLTAYFTEYSDHLKMKSLDATVYLKKCEYTELILENLLQEKIRAMSVSDMQQVALCDKYLRKYREETGRKFDQIISHYAIHCDLIVEEMEKKREAEKAENAGGMGLNQADKGKVIKR
jgi:hypothetical protein